MFLFWAICFFIPVFRGESTLNIIPYPVFSKVNSGTFSFNDKVKIFVPKNDCLVLRVANAFNDLFKLHAGYSFNVVEYCGQCPKINLSQIAFAYDSSITQDEGYNLLIEPSRIIIKGKSAHGMYHAFTTIRQMLPAYFEEQNKEKQPNKEPIQLQCAEILDYPRFPYRGFMLDVSRHFSTVEQVKRYIDLLAYHKLSIFHFHLTDDQGWRIEIKKYPKLTEIGAWREKKPYEMFSEDPEQGLTESQMNNSIYGGYYTQKQIKDILAYAENRFIRVQPEIEVPGHSSAAIASYPWLSCNGRQISVVSEWGIFSPVLCAKEEVLKFVEDVLTEVMDLFPSEVIHVGGDECHMPDWGNCSECQKQMKKLGLSNPQELHGYFMRRMAEHCRKRGRRIIGWDEIASVGYSDPSVQVMVWHSARKALQMVKEGHDVVLSPTTHCYLDYPEIGGISGGEKMTDLSAAGEEDDDDEAFSTRAYLNGLEKIYSFDPLALVFPPKAKTFSLLSFLRSVGCDDKRSSSRHLRYTFIEKQRLAKHVLGGQGNLWTERLPTRKQREFNTFPRLAALSEALWSREEDKDYESFVKRMREHMVERYKAMGVNYNGLNLGEEKVEGKQSGNKVEL
ncbi:putative beta-N-acetylglucosaminidase [Monocercomonoides exilis]|uniref:putative beta-N-acetylglucosaminidase n=1 Tax=Monocercomonoides exilis TaxID=2049356 RepID=UPI003559E0B6|nr:putative beta-N-acetylglucosaminidase [Monocercomonoides exilis]|eukprot:MONOS_11272.1-p1 / transcript=MONOS_11272.1 / gene=MONOS_11272 / organism=Monocercomonoides_exilis_PA203 / gene_product=beta-N-acetylglucosaminidase / transcript_product=beta-N-acetylglucosaminidase / location=Mono_scaffold00557:17173-19029(-) / protein_length=618 / sequence_SO=supercontig / SO=protein_coding / is_pseudo=false